MKVKTKKWIKAAIVRAVKTLAQTAIAVIGSAMVFSQIDVKTLISASLLSAVLSILTSLAGLPEVKE